METTVYIDAAHHRAGVGTALYTVLLETLRQQNFRSAIGIIALPHPASVGLHERLGFRCMGVLPAIGFKHGRWHDVGYWQRELREREEPPGAPLPLGAVVGTAAWEETCARAAATVRDPLPVAPRRG
jgi:phosphinothricin acetyltransferase